MRIRPLIPLLELRWRLFWAEARSQGGSVGLAFALAVFALMAAGLGLLGTRVGAVGARLGKLSLVAGGAFAALFLLGLLAALSTGLADGPAFSDQSLRRYPITRLERLTARYAVGLFDPVWLFVFALDLGLACGFAAVGASAPWLAVVAAILLVLVNYLAARLLAAAIDRFMTSRLGPLLLILGVILVIPLTAILTPALRTHDRAIEMGFLATLRFTPPLEAAAVAAGAGALASVGRIALILGWLFGLGAVLVAVEWKPPRPQGVPSAAGAEATWGGFYDRITAALGTRFAPLAGKTLRGFFRSPRMRYGAAIAVFLPLLFAFFFARGRADSLAGFLVVLAVIGWVGYASTGPMITNLFGSDRSGFRRYFLLPVPAAAAFQAAAIVLLLLGAIEIPVSLGACLIFWRRPVSASMVAMLLSSGFGGLFLFHALGLWTSLLSPFAEDPFRAYSNRPPFAQTALNLGSGIGVYGLALALLALGSRTILAYWWTALFYLLAAATFYIATLLEGARVFRDRRERILFTIERGS